jgi:ubiquinone/menaquinone biosynthesis C-methylase UbiE
MERYTHGHDPIVVDAHARRTAEEAAAFLLPHLEPGMRILDLGCGPGTITVGLARYVAPAEVIGVDRSGDVLTRARAHAAAEHMDRVRFVTASVYDLPFAAGEFDVVYAHQLLQHLSDPVAALVEARRVLRPGGYLAVRDGDFGTFTHHPHQPLIDRWLTVYTAVARANGGEPEAGRRLLQWVTAAGFTHTHATTSSWVFADPASRTEWAALWAGRIAVPHFADRAVELGVTSRDELAEIGAAFASWAADPVGWFGLIHGEVLAQAPGTTGGKREKSSRVIE